MGSTNSHLIKHVHISTDQSEVLEQWSSDPLLRALMQMSRLQTLEMSMIASPWEGSDAISGATQAIELARKVLEMHPSLSVREWEREETMVIRSTCEPQAIFFSFKLFSDEHRVTGNDVLVEFEAEMKLIQVTFLAG